MSKKLVPIVVAVLGVVAIVTGLIAVIGGPAAEFAGKAAVPSVDSQFRYANYFWLAAGFILIWTSRKPLERALVTRTILVIAAVAGLGRLTSLILVGAPAPFYLVTMGLELIVTPLIVVWHARTFRVRARLGITQAESRTRQHS